MKISITLDLKEWEQIESACILAAEQDIRGEIDQETKEILRKTYFTIKALTR